MKCWNWSVVRLQFQGRIQTKARWRRYKPGKKVCSLDVNYQTHTEVSTGSNPDKESMTGVRHQTKKKSQRGQTGVKVPIRSDPKGLEKKVKKHGNRSSWKVHILKHSMSEKENKRCWDWYRGEICCICKTSIESGSGGAMKNHSLSKSCKSGTKSPMTCKAKYTVARLKKLAVWSSKIWAWHKSA